MYKNQTEPSSLGLGFRVTLHEAKLSPKCAGTLNTTIFMCSFSGGLSGVVVYLTMSYTGASGQSLNC